MVGSVGVGSCTLFGGVAACMSVIGSAGFCAHGVNIVSWGMSSSSSAGQDCVRSQFSSSDSRGTVGLRVRPTSGSGDGEGGGTCCCVMWGAGGVVLSLCWSWLFVWPAAVIVIVRWRWLCVAVMPCEVRVSWSRRGVFAVSCRAWRVKLSVCRCRVDATCVFSCRVVVS